MGTQTFQIGTTIEYGKNIYRLKRLVDEDIWQIENLRTGRIEEISLSEMRKFYLEKKLKFESSALGRVVKRDKQSGRSYLDEKSFEVAKKRLRYVKEILDIPATHKSVKDKIESFLLNNPHLPPAPSASTLLRLKKLYLENDRDLTSLVPRHNKKGNRFSRYDSMISDIVDSVIESKYLCLERHTIQDVQDEVIALIKIQNNLAVKSEILDMPKRNYIESKVRKIPEFDRVAARYGYTAAIHQFRSCKEVPAVLGPLERVEIDHTKLDLFVIDDSTGALLGRPWVTLCIDVFSRSVLGLHVGFDEPSHMTVAFCLKHAFLPKSNIVNEGINIRNTWVQHGVMKQLVVDNGMEFHSKSLENTCFSLGIEIHYSARKTPWFKGKVERFFKELNGGVAHKSPGTTFSNIFDKGDYDPKKHAAIRYSALKPIIQKWIVDVYHQKPHSTLQAAPIDMWRDNISEDEIGLPEDLDFLDATLGKSDVRSLSHKGIEYDRVFYNSNDLAALRRALGGKMKVDIRIDDSDIGQIIVVSPHTGALLRVPALCFDYANGTSRYQHKVVQHHTIKRKRENISDSWLISKHEISELIQEEKVTGKRLQTRSRATKYEEHSKADLVPETVIDRESESDLSWEMAELDTEHEEISIEDEILSFNVVKRKNSFNTEVAS
jgi:putative transposase